MNSDSELHPCKKIKLFCHKEQNLICNDTNNIIPSNHDTSKDDIQSQSKISMQCNVSKSGKLDFSDHDTDFVNCHGTEDDVFTFPPDGNICDMLDGNNLANAFSTVTNRYLTPYYKLNVQNPGDDICIMVHTNRICMLCLAPSHTILKTGTKIEKVNFKVSDKVDRTLNKVSGKGKHGAQPLQANSNICIISCADGQNYTIKCCIIGKLVEINEKLLKDPELLRKPPHKGGYLAIILPNIQLLDKIKDSLLPQEQYETLIKGELNSDNKHDKRVIEDSMVSSHIAKDLNSGIVSRLQSHSTSKHNLQLTHIRTHTI